MIIECSASMVDGRERIDATNVGRVWIGCMYVTRSLGCMYVTRSLQRGETLHKRSLRHKSWTMSQGYSILLTSPRLAPVWILPAPPQEGLPTLPHSKSAGSSFVRFKHDENIRIAWKFFKQHLCRMKGSCPTYASTSMHSQHQRSAGTYDCIGSMSACAFSPSLSLSITCRGTKSQEVYDRTAMPF